MNKPMTHLLLWSLFLLLHQKTWSQTNQAVQAIELTQELIEKSGSLPSVRIKASRGIKFRWNTGETTQFIEVPLQSQERYSVEIEEANGLHANINTSVAHSRLLKNNKNTIQNTQAPDPGCPNTTMGGYYSRICSGTTLTLTATGGTSYLWDNGATSSSITVSPNITTAYTVTITYSDPEDHCVDIKTTGPIEVVSQPTASIAGGNINFCSPGGGATLTASGGAGVNGLSYQWSTGETTASISPYTNVTRSYGVTVSTGSGLCTSQASTTIGVTQFNPSIQGAYNICLGTGILLTATGGGTYQWDNSSNSSSRLVTPTTVGNHTYSVTITSGNCSAVRSHTVTVSSPPTAQISGPASACYNSSVTLSASGSGTYAWSTGATTSSINTSLLQSTQTYRLTVTNPSTQCSSVDEHVVSVLPSPTLNEAPNSICAGESVNLSVSGGSSYSWNVGGTTASIQHSPSSSTEYRVTVTDASGCSYVLSKNIAVTNPPNITFGGGTSICAGQSLNITAFGGSSYSWSYNSANTATITVSPTTNTTYTVTATSSGGCISTAQRVITVKPSPNGIITGAGSICPGQSVTLTASGGNSYAWNGGASTASITVSPTQNTNYTVSISNAEGCTVVKSHAIAVNISGSASNDGPLTCSKTSATLIGTSSAQGASYRWKNASGVTIANTANTTVTTAGVYTLEITAAGGCTYSTATEVLQNLQTPSVSASNSGAITCTQSSVNLIGTSSATPATYEWRNGGGVLIASTLNASTTQAGTYTLKVTAVNGCSSTASTTVTADVATPQASIQHDGPLSCTKTSVTLSASPNNPNLQYTWRNSSGTVIASNSSSVVVTATGTYQLEAKGSNGCTTTVSTNITQSGNFPNISVNNPGYISCTSSGATISGNSTTPGVTYAWYNPNGRLMSTQKSFVTNIAGTYTLKVTSAEGCVSSASTILSEDVPNNQAITLNVGGHFTNGSFAQGELTCTQSSIRLSVSARYAGYDVAVYWTNASGQVIGSRNFEDVINPGYYYVYHQECPAVVKEIYIKENRPAPVVQITGEQLVCAGKRTTLTASGGGEYYWSTGATSNTITTDYIYSPTTYTVTVSTGTYCSTTANVTVGNHPNPVININGATSLCAGTSVTLTASGGQTYKWNAGNATTTSITVAPSVPTTYTVTVTSDKGCAASKSHVISTITSLPNDFTLNNVPSTPFCGEAPLNISVANPNSNYTWSWSTGETTTSIQRTITSSQTISVTARRNNGCTRTKTIPITVNPKPQGFIAGADINCAGESTVLTAPLGETYVWSTGATSSSISLQPSSSQTYNVTVSNAGGTCSTVFSKTVAVPAPLSLSHNLAGADDCIPNNVTVIPAVSGGTGNVSLGIIRSGELYVSENLSGLRSGTYLLRAEDTKGCLALEEIVIAETPVMITHTGLSNLNDCTPNNVSLNVVASGSKLPFTYRLNGNAMTGTSATVPSGTHFIEVQDAIGCIARDTVTVNETPQIQFQSELQPVPCFGAADGSIAIGPLQDHAGTPPYTYLWSTGATTAQISQLAAGTYAVTATDARGCPAVLSGLVITQPSELEVEVEISDSLSCVGSSNAAVVATVNGGTAPYTYTWSTGASSTGIEGLSSGTYTVTVVDSQGCEAIGTVSIVNPPKLMLSYTLLGDTLDCVQGNVQLKLAAQNARGPVEFRINPNGNPDTIFTVASGIYEVFAIDSAGCRDTLEVVVNERLPYDLRAYQRNTEDCNPNNTTIAVYGQSARGSLSFQLDDGVPQTDSLFSNVAPGAHRLYFIDSSGCRDSFFVLVADETQIPVGSQGVSHCDTADASAAIYLQPSNPTVQYQYSLDAGQTWQNEYTFDNLAPGQYFPAVKKLPLGCVILGDTLLISDTCRAYALAGFSKDTVMITHPNQKVLFPWLVETPRWMQDNFGLRVTLQGSGEPHFVEFNPGGNTNTLRSERVFAQRQYQNGFAGSDLDSTALASTANLFTYPQEYTFTLLSSTPNKLRIDPKRKDLRVVVVFDPETYTEITVIICKGESTTLNPGPGSCFNWEDGSTEGSRTVDPTEDTEYTVTVLDDKLQARVIRYKVKVLDVDPEITVETDPAELCEDGPIKLKASPVGAQYTYLWNTGATTAEISVSGSSLLDLYQVTVTERRTDSGGNVKTCEAVAEMGKEEILGMTKEKACQKIFSDLLEKGFIPIPCSIQPPALTRPELRSNEVSDYANLTIEIDGQVINLKAVFEDIIAGLQSGGTHKGYITKNENLCPQGESIFEEIEGLFNPEVDLWAHIFNGCQQDILFIKEGLFASKIVEKFGLTTNISIDNPFIRVSLLEPARPNAFTISEFITLIENEENKYNDGSECNTNLMLTRLRKIFYGSEGFNNFLIKEVADVPVPPPYRIVEKIVGRRHVSLGLLSFDMVDKDIVPVMPNGERPAIFSDGYSQEVKLESPPYQGIAVDIGHVLSGMDAYCHKNDVGLPIPVGISIPDNMGPITWVGDLGSVMAEAQILFNNNDMNPLFDSEIQAVIKRYAPPVDMLGNIDAYAISKSFNICATTGCKKISQILREYYLGENSKQSKRYSIFAKSIGLVWNGNGFDNEDELVEKYGKQVADAAALYILIGSNKDLRSTGFALVLSWNNFGKVLVRHFFQSLAIAIKTEE